MIIRTILTLMLAAPVAAQVSPEAKQSAAEEREQMDAQVDEDKLPIDISVMLGGKPFPDPFEYENPTPRPKRRIEITETDNLNTALARLEPGDQLVMAPGAYEGSFAITEKCKDGTTDAPIQIFARGAVLRPLANTDAVLRIEKSHWSITGIQIVVADSSATAVVIGEKAHDVILDGAHLYNGLGLGVLIQPGAQRITIANSHIHHFGRKPQTSPTGIALAAGVSEISIVGNHLHHNRGPSIGFLPAEGAVSKKVQIRGNKLHDDKASAISVAWADDVRVVGNKIYNYRPVGLTRGEAIDIGPETSHVIIEKNHFAEATIGVQIAGAKEVAIRGNYLENRLTPESTAFKVMSGSAITIAHNVVDRYRHALRSAAAIAFTNNVIIEPAGVVFEAEHARIASNVIGWNGQSLPGAKAIKGLDLKDRDLAKLGLPLSESGEPLDAGIPEE